ncbi:MAG: hypothetical protein LBC27_09825, partial [Spirochaetaceae bacterium]|nr:hypothetical protein [Spirochaetaceae bacterium]
NEIRLLKPVDIDSTIEITKNIKLVQGTGYSISRKSGFPEALFNVPSDGKLTLGGGGGFGRN